MNTDTYLNEIYVETIANEVTWVAKVHGLIIDSPIDNHSKLQLEYLRKYVEYEAFQLHTITDDHAEAILLCKAYINQIDLEIAKQTKISRVKLGIDRVKV